jgi:hypothetical protein
MSLYEELVKHVFSTPGTDDTSKALRFLCDRIERQQSEAVDATVALLEREIQKERRFRAAKAAMGGMLANPGIGPGLVAGGYSEEQIPHVLLRASVNYADALLAALDRPKEPT